MQVWRPAAIFLGRTDGRELFTLLNLLAYFQALQRIRSEMAVQRVEGFAPCRRMFENDHRAIIERSGIVDEGLYRSGQKRMNGRARRREEIETEMNGAGFVN